MRVKYPRTFNLPFSQSDSSDDVWWKNTSVFDGLEVVVTEKLDGEATTVYPDGYVHARSIDSRHHESRSWIKSFASSFAYKIPAGMRVCGENLYAYHTIFYDQLPTYFFVYGIYDGDTCLSWEDTELICEDIGLQIVPILYKGLWDEKAVKELWTGEGVYPTYRLKQNVTALTPTYPNDFKKGLAEGYVVRAASSFSYHEFRTHCAKFVSDKFKAGMRDIHGHLSRFSQTGFRNQTVRKVVYKW